jgi:hypothetical protein
MPNRKVRLNPVPSPVLNMDDYRWRTWFSELRSRTGEGPLLVQGYSVASLPAAEDWGSIDPDDPFSSMIFIYDEAGGPVMAYSNGTNWLRVTDGGIVS